MPPRHPEQLAETIRVRLEGDLPQPVAATSPPADEPAIVNHPAFLAIDNWTGTITDQECAGTLCVTVTATPTLTWTPGEPGAATLTCAGGGTTYDPTGAPPQDQAAQPGACAHAYQTRTGVAGRPDTWPGAATVTWTLDLDINHRRRRPPTVDHQIGLPSPRRRRGPGRRRPLTMVRAFGSEDGLPGPGARPVLAADAGDA